jgi:molecular chaperone HscB
VRPERDFKEKQDTAQAISARVNEAYQALLKPLPRAEYILGQHHIPISEKDQVDDIEFMSEVMEAREIIDDAEDESEVVNLVKDNRGLLFRVYLATIRNKTTQRQR